MRHLIFNRKAVFLLALILFCFTSRVPKASADFRLLDAIQEFGEKRFVKQKPARLGYGPVRFYPRIRQAATYDDNILLEDDDNRSDVVWNTQPSIIMEIPIDRHQVAVGYEADIEVFTKSRHAKQNDQNQNFFALVDVNYPSWYVNVLERFTETSGRGGTTFTGRIPRYDQSIHPKVGIRWNQFILEQGFRHFYRDFRRQVDDSLNFQLVEWTTILYYDLFARLKALLESQVSQIDYDDDFERNGTFTQFRAGLIGEMIPNMKIELRGGMQFRNYETESETDFNSWVAAIKVEYRWRQNWLFHLSGERVPLEATFQNVNFFTRHIGRLGLEYQLTPQWIMFQNVKYYRDSYTERATVSTRSGFRRDNHMTYESGVRYLPTEWWELELSYEFFYRNSNFNTFDYTDNRVSLSTTLAY